ncbi:hypothetical protein QA597_04050 [Marinilabiliaceae bacterium ANBcel2]|nr:hypothetical protein [Marinilabiliaceae bacterium ANBcel2]
MKKGAIFFTVFIMGLFVIVNSSAAQEEFDEEVTKTEVSVNALPQPITDALEEEKFEGWRAARAEMIIDMERTYYAVTMLKEVEREEDRDVKVINFSPQGELIDLEEDDDDK